MDCFHDFCLACDRESTAGPYCSQACRLADLEKSHSGSSSPTSEHHHHRQPSWASSTLGSGSGYILPRSPPTKASRRPTSPSAAHSSSSHASKSQSFNSRRPAAIVTEQRPDHHHPHSLTPSSSRASLSSTASGASPMSEQARLELEQYFASFDQAKAAKRRQSAW